MSGTEDNITSNLTFKHHTYANYRLTTKRVRPQKIIAL